MKSILWIIGVIIIIALGTWVFYGSTPASAPVADTANDQTMEDSTSAPPPPGSRSMNTGTSMGESATSTASERTIVNVTVTGKNFSFSPAEIRVKKGDTVRVTFINEGGTHDWVLDEFNARTAQIGSGQTANVEFVADRTGTFEYYCSVGTHRRMGMVGNLIVE